MWYKPIWLEPFIVGREGARRMITSGKPGCIMNITSVHSVNPGPGVGAYPATKAGLALLARLMDLECGEYGIRANAITPRFIDVGMSKPFFEKPRVRELRENAVPLKRLGTAENIANTVFTWV